MSEKSKAGGKKPAASGKKTTTKAAVAKKSVAKKTAVKKTPAAKSRAPVAAATKPVAKKATSAKSVAKPRAGNGVSPEERWRRIAEGAYLRAEARGFEGGDPVADWLAAEAEVDASLRY